MKFGAASASLLFMSACCSADQRLRPFFATIESPTPAQWAYSFAGAPAVSLNDADTTCNGGWFIPNYNESRNPFLLMLNGTDISIDAKWRFFVDKKLLACGIGPAGFVDGAHGLPVLGKFVVPDQFSEYDESKCTPTHTATVGPYKYDRTCGYCQEPPTTTKPSLAPTFAPAQATVIPTESPIFGAPPQVADKTNFPSSFPSSPALPNPTTTPTPAPSQDLIKRTISGQVLEDIDNNDTGDVPIGGVTIELKYPDGTIAMTTLTDSAGKFIFYAPPGVYTIDQKTPTTGFVNVKDNDGGDINSIDIDIRSSSSFNNEFVDKRPGLMPVVSPAPSAQKYGSISGCVKEDTDNNDSGDTNLVGVVVTLYDHTGNVIATTVTDGACHFVFNNLQAGNYVVKETNPHGLIDVSDPDGDLFDSTITVQLGGGKNVTLGDFIDEQLRTIAGQVLEDIDNNDSGDVPIGSVSIELKYPNGTVAMTTATDSNGTFTFDAPPGIYTIFQKTPSEFLNIRDSDGNTPDSIAIDTSTGSSLTNEFVDERPSPFPSAAPTTSLTADPTVSPTPSPIVVPGTPSASPTDAPSEFPTDSPTPVPTRSPTNAPTADPTLPPTPSTTVFPGTPSASPANTPSGFPTDSPTPDPTEASTNAPTADPTDPPTPSPTVFPGIPSASPTNTPSGIPTDSPTPDPTESPTNAPTPDPTSALTHSPTTDPSVSPTSSPTTLAPTPEPSLSPSRFTTEIPSFKPTISLIIAGQVLEDINNNAKGDVPIAGVTVELKYPDGTIVMATVTNSNGNFTFTTPPGVYIIEQKTPTGFINVRDSDGGNNNSIAVDTSSGSSLSNDFVDRRPSLPPTVAPTAYPTAGPITIPTLSPTEIPGTPSAFPTETPTRSPSASLTPGPPTGTPTPGPTQLPTASPTNEPTTAPTASPTASPSANPTFSPTPGPTQLPTASPTDVPTSSPTAAPSSSPTPGPTQLPTASPTDDPTIAPTPSPTASPSATLTSSPTPGPTQLPTVSPTNEPTMAPTASPTASPTAVPTSSPTPGPTNLPTASPTNEPTMAPTASPTASPTTNPSSSPTPGPIQLPTASPTHKPTMAPTPNPTASPTVTPIALPTAGPTNLPTALPTNVLTIAPTASPTPGPTASPTSIPTKILVTPSPVASCNCALPDLSNYALIVEGNCTSSANNFAWPAGIAVGGTLKVTDSQYTYIPGASYLGAINVNNWNFGGGKTVSANALGLAGVDFAALKCLAQSATSTDIIGSFKVIVMTSGGTFTQSSFRPQPWDPYSNREKTLVNFNTNQDVILNMDTWINFGLSVLAPFSKVTSNVNYVGGFIAAREFIDTVSTAQYGGVYFTGALSCGLLSPVTTALPTSSPTPLPTSSPTPPTPVPPAPTSQPVVTPAPVPTAAYNCALPTATLNYALITAGDAKVSAHDVYRAVHIGGTLTDGSTNDNVISANYQNQVSWMGALGSPVKPTAGATLEIKGPNVQNVPYPLPNYVVGGSPQLDFAFYEWLTRNAKSSTSGNYMVVVVTTGGTYNTENFRGPNGQGSDNGNTLVIFNTNQDVTLDCTSSSRQFGPSVIAPFSKVIIKGRAGYVDGLVVAKQFTDDNLSADSLQMHGNVYTGPITCV